MPFEIALSSATTHKHDYRTLYVMDLENVVDMYPLRSSGIQLVVRSAWWSGVHYWDPIAERYGLSLKVVNDAMDPIAVS